MTVMTDSLPIVEAAMGGDARALDRLAGLWLPTVLRWCTRMGGPRVDPEDAAHDVFLVVMRRIRDLGDAAAFPSWLFQVTRKTLARARRKAWFARWVPGASLERADSAPSPARRRALSEASRAVQTILEGMTDAHREVFVLCVIEERTDEDAAALLGVPVGTAKSRLRAARQHFHAAAEALDLRADLDAFKEGA